MLKVAIKYKIIDMAINSIFNNIKRNFLMVPCNYIYGREITLDIIGCSVTEAYINRYHRHYKIGHKLFSDDISIITDMYITPRYKTGRHNLRIVYNNGFNSIDVIIMDGDMLCLK